MSMADAEVFEAVAAYYDRLVTQYGKSHRACDYGSALSQQAKFRVLAEVLDLSGKSVLDVGCGLADFADFLAKTCPDVRYTGIDLSPGMVALARAGHPGLDIRAGNVLSERFDRYDVVVANGIFYLLGTDAARMMRDLVVKMFEIATEALAFNSLSEWGTEQEAGEFYANPLATVEMCRPLTPRMVLRHDYHARDFTVYLYKGCR
jgi:SAM-dependent methyltransferase